MVECQMSNHAASTSGFQKIKADVGTTVQGSGKGFTASRFMSVEQLDDHVVFAIVLGHSVGGHDNARHGGVDDNDFGHGDIEHGDGIVHDGLPGFASEALR